MLCITSVNSSSKEAVVESPLSFELFVELETVRFTCSLEDSEDARVDKVLDKLLFAC